MKLTVSTPSGLHIEFEGASHELPRLDTFLEEIARVERERITLPAIQPPATVLTIDADEKFVPFPDPSPPTALALAAEPDGEDQPSPAIAAVDPPVVRRQQSPHEGRVIGAAARAAMSAQLAERHGEHPGQALALVAEHGPVAPAWVADQLVKNRRDTIALMRDMAAAGELVETDEGGYYDIPDRDDQEQAVAA